MPTLSPFIHFNGNAEEAFHFYKSVFGGEFSIITRFKDVEALQPTLPQQEENKIMQISLPIGKHSFLMGSDVPAFMGRVNEHENRSKISVQAESKAEAENLFNSLSINGEIEVAFNENNDGSSFGMFRDQFGIEWMIHVHSGI